MAAIRSSPGPTWWPPVSANKPGDDRLAVAVIGGGPAGCAAALGLARAGIERVALFEASPSARSKLGESLPPDARPLLRSLGVWDSFVEQGHAPCLGNCSAWGGDSLGYSDYVMHPLGPGWHLDRQRFESWLLDQTAQAGIGVELGTRLVAITRTDHGFRLDLRGPNGPVQRHARHVIDATGSNARVARLLGADRRWLDRLFFTYGYFVPPPDTAVNRLTLVEAVPDGWWYRAALPDGRLALALACELQTLREQRLDRWQPWLNHLAQTRHAATGLAGSLFLKDAMTTMAAPSFRLEPAIGDGWLAVGDAAGAFDPLLARGIAKALEDGLEAAQVVARWLQQGECDPAAEYASLLAARFQTMVFLRKRFYAIEQRWPDAPFWQARRRASSGVTALRTERAKPIPSGSDSKPVLRQAMPRPAERR